MPLQWSEMIAKERERAYMDYVLSIIQSGKKNEEGRVVNVSENRRGAMGEATQDRSW